MNFLRFAGRRRDDGIAGHEKQHGQARGKRQNGEGDPAQADPVGHERGQLAGSREQADRHGGAGKRGQGQDLRNAFEQDVADVTEHQRDRLVALEDLLQRILDLEQHEQGRRREQGKQQGPQESRPDVAIGPADEPIRRSGEVLEDLLRIGFLDLDGLRSLPGQSPVEPPADADQRGVEPVDPTRLVARRPAQFPIGPADPGNQDHVAHPWAEPSGEALADRLAFEESERHVVDHDDQHADRESGAPLPERTWVSPSGAPRSARNRQDSGRAARRLSSTTERTCRALAIT